MIKEAIFDIDDTLYNYEKGHEEGMRRLCLYAKEHLQVEPEEFREAYKRTHHEITEKLGRDNAAIHSRSIRIQNLLEKWGKPLFPHVKAMYHAYWDTLLKESGPEPGAVACMQELKDMGITIGIGTDMTAMMQYEKLEAFGFAPYVSHIVTSQEAGVEKPHPDFMALCIQKSGVLPEECVFVGDNFKKDACGASAYGMHGVWYNFRGKELPKGAEEFAGKYKEIRHFDELVPYIQALNKGE
ncbi:MAG: HAD-IA family hydrolase [Lachnospiraceae bacterium]|jgi:putative hydrolase of the HAD superfamily|uniref:HAD family hydrolase n=1 Tax=Candidatus Merdisoma sp. JLR.KK006 TaxID=3112626 RepID=UPI002FF30E31|nr:HAD-IA family hydrolase [Lachnospiraceae bacterium]